MTMVAWPVQFSAIANPVVVEEGDGLLTPPNLLLALTMGSTTGAPDPPGGISSANFGLLLLLTN